MKKIIILLVALMSTAVNAEIISEMTAYKVEVKDNKEIFVDANNVRPNEIIEYRMVFKNKDSKKENIELSGLINKDFVEYIKEGTTLLPNKKILFSVDGVNWDEKPFYTKIVNNEEIKVYYKNSDYSNIKWIINKIDINEKLELKYRVKVK